MSGNESSKHNRPNKTKTQKGSGKNRQKKRSVREKSGNCLDKNISLVFVAWEGNGTDFLKGVNLSHVPENLRVHVFYSKGTPVSELPKFTSWLIGHESLTDSVDALWVDLTAYLVTINTRFSAKKACPKCAARPEDNVSMTLVCGENARGSELAALLKANKIEMNVMDGRNMTLIDMFQHVCRCCKMIFKDSMQAEKHDKTCHNFLCNNIQCEHSKRGNGFFTREELEIHLRAQKFCKFCPSDAFCKDEMFSKHVKDNHKNCPCSCKEYYERDEDLFEQYYARFPLPCLEEPACKARFKDIDTQAFHHKTYHGAEYPYFCMACYKNEKLVCRKTGDELLRHANDEGHVKEDFQFAIIPRKLLAGSFK